MKAQHVSSGTPLIIRRSKLYLQPLVYMPIWWPAVAKAEWLSLGNGRSSNGHINQRLQIKFRAPDDERCAARIMLSLQKNFGIISSIISCILLVFLLSTTNTTHQRCNRHVSLPEFVYLHPLLLQPSPFYVCWLHTFQLRTLINQIAYKTHRWWL